MQLPNRRGSALCLNRSGQGINEAGRPRVQHHFAVHPSRSPVSSGAYSYTQRTSSQAEVTNRNPPVRSHGGRAIRAPRPGGNVSYLSDVRLPAEDGRGTELSITSNNPRQSGQRTVSRPVGGVLSPPKWEVGGHPSARPTWGVPSLLGGRAAHVPYLALLRVGFAEPLRSPGALVRSYRTVSPLPVPSPAIGGLFSVALSFGSPRLASRAPCPLEPRPSSTPKRRGHPAGSPSERKSAMRRPDGNGDRDC